jgi:hypothetical protein
MSRKKSTKPDISLDPRSRTPKAVEMAKRRRGPSSSDQRRRTEFHRADETMKGHTKDPA